MKTADYIELALVLIGLISAMIVLKKFDNWCVRKFPKTDMRRYTRVTYYDGR
jgi:hypothetical protein